jgi:hypothetical protein
MEMVIPLELKTQISEERVEHVGIGVFSCFDGQSKERSFNRGHSTAASSTNTNCL